MGKEPIIWDPKRFQHSGILGVSSESATRSLGNIRLPETLLHGGVSTWACLSNHWYPQKSSSWALWGNWSSRRIAVGTCRLFSIVLDLSILLRVERRQIYRKSCLFYSPLSLCHDLCLTDPRTYTARGYQWFVILHNSWFFKVVEVSSKSHILVFWLFINMSAH